MRIKLWGTRGSVATPEAAKAGYGGSTPCIEVRASDGELFVLDAGIGLHFLGKTLLERAAGAAIEGTILLTHFHWDHIQGIPFFMPFYFEGNRFTICGNPGTEDDLEAVLRYQMDACYCPVPNFFDDRTGADLNLVGVGEGRFEMGATTVSTRHVNHVAGEPCLGYRLESGSRALAYIPDVEYLDDEHREAAIDLARDVDLLIHDAHFAADRHVRGSGHSSDAHAVEIGQAAGAAQMLLFHHHPEHADETIDAMVSSHRGNGLLVEGAREGAELVLEGV